METAVLGSIAGDRDLLAELECVFRPALPAQQARALARDRPMFDDAFLARHVQRDIPVWVDEVEPGDGAGDNRFDCAL